MTKYKTKRDENDETVDELRNEDPISGEAGAHPVGVGIGTAVGGAAAGAAAGAVGGPIGAIIGAVAGGVTGGLAGKATAEQIDPTVEVEHWRSAYAKQPYYSSSRKFNAYEPAYRAGVEAYDPAEPLTWEEREEVARERYETDQRELPWDNAKLAARDAYNRVHTNYTKKPR